MPEVTAGKPMLEVKNLKKYFKVKNGWLHAVDNINFSLEKGKTLGVVGESGCGKSTLGRTILRLIEPSSGEIWFNGQDITKLDQKAMRKKREEMQIIFQDPYASINPRMSVSEIIAEPLLVNHTYSNKIERLEYIDFLMETVGLASRLYNYNFITVFISSVFLFLYFKNIEIRNSKIINIVSKIAPLTFAVYIIHEQTVLREILYLDILNLDQLWNNAMQLVIIPVIVIMIFLICILLEKVTQNTIQKWIYNILEKFYLRLKSTRCYQKIQYKLLQRYCQK